MLDRASGGGWTGIPSQRGAMPSPSELFVLQHGQTEGNAEGRMQGRIDPPLTALGRAQARRA